MGPITLLVSLWQVYRLQTPQQPLCFGPNYNTFQMDEYPLGTNAVVAVISYTGYPRLDVLHVLLELALLVCRRLA